MRMSSRGVGDVPKRPLLTGNAKIFPKSVISNAHCATSFTTDSIDQNPLENMLVVSVIMSPAPAVMLLTIYTLPEAIQHLQKSIQHPKLGRQFLARSHLTLRDLGGGCQAPPPKDFSTLIFFEGREAPRLGGHLTELHYGTFAKKLMSVSVHIPE